MLKGLTITLALLTISQYAHAELYNCNGTYTNVPCDQSGKQDALPKANEIEPLKKQRWVEEYKRLADRVKLESDISVNTSDAISTCLAPITTNAECRQVLNAKEAEIYSLERAAKVKGKLEREQAKAELTKKENNTTQVNITNSESNTIAVAGSGNRVRVGGSDFDRDSERNIPPTNEPRNFSESLRRKANDPKQIKGALDPNTGMDEAAQLEQLRELQAQKDAQNSRIGHGKRR